MTAIEERDGFRFYIDKTPPLSPIRLIRTPGPHGRLVRCAPTSCSSRSAAPPGCAPPTTRSPGRCGAPARRWPWRAWPHAREPRTFALTDLAWAVPARRAARAALRAARPRAIVYCTTTAALLWPEPGAIRFDAPAAGNRPGRHGIWQRPVERRRLAAAPLLLPLTAAALAEAPPVATPGDRGADPGRAVRAGRRGDARPRGDHLRREPGEEGPGPRARRVAGGAARRRDARRRRARRAATSPASATPGCSPPDAYRALLRRARVFATAPRREDYGIAQLEALADGCALVTNAAPGPVRRAAARARAGPAAGRRRPRAGGAPGGARRSGARLRGARGARCSRRSRRRPSTASSPSGSCRRCSAAPARTPAAAAR